MSKELRKLLKCCYDRYGEAEFLAMVDRAEQELQRRFERKKRLMLRLRKGVKKDETNIP